MTNFVFNLYNENWQGSVLSACDQNPSAGTVVLDQERHMAR